MTADGFDGFEWDDEKSDRTFEERGIDFTFAARIFGGAYTSEKTTGDRMASSVLSLRAWWTAS